MLSGYKTYITAGLFILASWASFLIGGEDVQGVVASSMEDALRNTFEAGMVIFLRMGMKIKKPATTTKGR